MEATNTANASGFWMETEPLYPERSGFNPVVIYPEKGVIFMRTEKNESAIEKESDAVKVIAI